MGSPAVDSFTVPSDGTHRTAVIAAALAGQVRPGDAVILKGGLATGKTTFITAVAGALGSADRVTSPTFTLAHFYSSPAGPILHIDAYRLSGRREYRDLGLDDYAGDSVTLVEWGDKIAGEFPCHLLIELSCDGDDPARRLLTFSSGCHRWVPALRNLRAALLADAKAT